MVPSMVLEVRNFAHPIDVFVHDVSSNHIEKPGLHYKIDDDKHHGEEKQRCYKLPSSSLLDWRHESEVRVNTLLWRKEHDVPHGG